MELLHQHSACADRIGSSPCAQGSAQATDSRTKLPNARNSSPRGHSQHGCQQFCEPISSIETFIPRAAFHGIPAGERRVPVYLDQVDNPTQEEQEAALRHVVSVTPPPCGNLLTFVDLSDVDVQRVAREVVTSANERQRSTTADLSAGGTGGGTSVAVVGWWRINYSVTVTAAVDAEAAATLLTAPGTKAKAAGEGAVEEGGARKQVVVVKLLVWQPVPFTAHHLAEFILLDGEGGEAKGEAEGFASIDCAPPPPGHILLANCTTVHKAGYSSVAAPVGFVRLLHVLVSLGLVLALL
ncbi:unnamed protein product [Closterium sp. Naga37s-1]|nr:unnamed protein product [Closterium sp. Naga37s-1]